MDIPILYQDPTLCVAVKPVGVLSEPTGAGSGMPELLSNQLGGECFTVHRLDRVVGGVMVFSRDKRFTGKLTAQVAEHKVQKEYLAVLTGVPEQEEAELRDLLFRDSSKNKTFVVKRARKGVREAILSYRLLSTVEVEGQKLSLVRVKLQTGRTHQIRVQFASRGLSLLGDGRYGGKDKRCETALHSYHLGFTHPKTGKAMDFTALPKMEFPWNLFDLPTLLEENA